MNHLMLSTLTLFLLSFTTLFGQSELIENNFTQTEKHTLKQRYGYDYILNGYDFTNGDSTILESLNIRELLENRDYEKDLIRPEIEYGFDIIIFSEKKARLNWTNRIKSIQPDSKQLVE